PGRRLYSRKTRHVHYFEPRPLQARQLRKLPAIHRWHDDVGEQDIDLRLAIQHLQCRLGVASRQCLVAERFQLKNGGWPGGWVVVHRQDQFRSGGRSEIVSHAIRTGLCGGGLAAREVQFESRALSELALRADVAAGLSYESVDHAQPKPSPLALRLGREERFIN